MERKPTIDRRRLYQQIADDLERLMLEGVYPPGTRLPGEHELAELYGVSRNVVRETLKRLKERGLVVIRTGSGTFVRLPSTKPVSDALQRLLLHTANGVSIAHFYEIRRMIEPQSARLAAQRAREEDVRKIMEILHHMEASRTDSQEWTDADLQFHLAIASATQNPLLSSILDPLTGPLKRVIAAGHSDPSGTQAGLEAHRRIVEAIRDKDGDSAYQAMLEHLIDSEQRLAKLGFLL
jgi:DNA-binding FadR family transcriptional regulator